MLGLLGALRSSSSRVPVAVTHLPFKHTAVRTIAARSFSALPCEQDDAAHADVTVLPAPRFKALLLDAAGTLLSPSEPAAEVLKISHFLMGLHMPSGAASRTI